MASTPPTLRRVRPEDRSRATAQTPGLERETAVDGPTVGARTLWMGFVRVAPGVASGVHHHGDSESGIYVIRGRLRFRFGARLGETFVAEAGDFIYVPPHAVHQETNLSPEEPAETVVVRDRQENVVVAVDASPR
ncbi:MAG: cupin domain-containing protein [Methanobacteriota archaeon]